MTDEISISISLWDLPEMEEFLDFEGESFEVEDATIEGETANERIEIVVAIEEIAEGSGHE